MTFSVHGQAVSRGVAIGRAVLVTSSRIDVAHYFVAPEQMRAELERLREARDAVIAEIERVQRSLHESATLEAHPELTALLDVHLMLLQDVQLQEGVAHWVQERRYNAEWALTAQLELVVKQFDEMQDPYLRERKADFEQLVERMLQHMRGSVSPMAVGLPATAAQMVSQNTKDPLVLVAHDLSPADTLQFKHSVFVGFVTDVGGKTSHTAIVARSMDIPAVVGARGASQMVRQDDWVVIDGDALPALAVSAVGVGLFRTEFLFMGRAHGKLPDEDEQYEAYRAAVEGMHGLPVTIRSVDVGADKPLDRSRVDEHLNPALGLRAIRWSLSEPAMFLTQVRAVLRAAAHGKVNLLIPMLAHLREVQQVKALLAKARAQLDASAAVHGPVRLGAMIEIPAAALALRLFMKHFDFFSIGTNDLIQYTLAIDRVDESVAHLYDPLHPAVLQLVAGAIAECRDQGKPVSVCGEMAGDPTMTRLLLGLGLRSFSMHPSQILAVKQQVLRADTRKLRLWAQQVIESEDPAVQMAN
ncbi:MAG: phosphoenolpyruvate--protein phosphotransferase [Comamonadaceae bacterium 32-67-11]|nr:MAG: phosphoenolpyruvate--protein phosphotransferase [Comamonadaceae bacterium 32-67-11]